MAENNDQKQPPERSHKKAASNEMDARVPLLRPYGKDHSPDYPAADDEPDMPDDDAEPDKPLDDPDDDDEPDKPLDDPDDDAEPDKPLDDPDDDAEPDKPLDDPDDDAEPDMPLDDPEDDADGKDPSPDYPAADDDAVKEPDMPDAEPEDHIPVSPPVRAANGKLPGIEGRDLSREMKQSYLDYSMSVIVGRALPDARDGLKPVHRRILYAMNEMGMHHNKPYKKSARIVGEVLGKYHPHGDSSVYEALVRMTQDFSLRYPLVDGQGNFGSIDGDSAAAMRYTEARLKKISGEILRDIEKETVAFGPNFDDSLKEPLVLPTMLPNLLVNGSSGIAVGMATNIPPHNLREICDGIIALVKDQETTLQDLLGIVKGPDFPTGGIIQGRRGIEAGFLTGRGRCVVRAKTSIEDHKNRQWIIVSEIPYQVNKSLLIEQIAALVREKRIDGISDLRDESDRDGMRIVIELKIGANHEIVLNQLYKHSRLQDTFGINTLALVDNRPVTQNLRQLMEVFINHRFDVITRRTAYDLRKAKERAHILEGLIIALRNIDSVIAKIKASKDAKEAQETLITDYDLSEIQAKAILDMRLQKLASLEQQKIRDEHAEIMQLISELQGILDDKTKINAIIRKETEYIKETYGDDRRTMIVEGSDDDYDIDMEDLIDPEDMIITITHQGYIKRLSQDTYREQRRGGKGVRASTQKEEDYIKDLFVANTHDYLLFFTDRGQVHWLKVYKIPESGRIAKGTAIINLLPLEQGENVTAFVAARSFDTGYLMMATRGGTVKKTKLSLFSNPRKGGIRAITLSERDALIEVKHVNDSDQVILATRNGKAIKFTADNIRDIGRSGMGVRGIRLRSGDAVIGMVVAPEEKTLLTLTENGYGKRSPISDYRLINRGGQGVISIICSERNGKVADIRCIDDADSLVLITQRGIAIRVPASSISVIGRNTQGVRIMRLGEGDRLVASAKILNENDEDTGTGPEGD